jgi:hypothetical protein
MHIASMQENKKFADDISDSLVHTNEDADHKFTVSVPKSESYFPVLRYKCIPDLRPVPIVSCSANIFGLDLMSLYVSMSNALVATSFSVFKQE